MFAHNFSSDETASVDFAWRGSRFLCVNACGVAYCVLQIAERERRAHEASNRAVKVNQERANKAWLRQRAKEEELKVAQDRVRVGVR